MQRQGFFLSEQVVLIYMQDLARPKSLSGKPTSGSNLASLIEKLVEALNVQEIPNVASMLQVFNR
jgi:hypothetical protein